MSNQRYCIGCVSCYFDPGREGYYYSSMTYDNGSSVSLECRRGHWEVKHGSTTQQEFSEFMEKAETCPDFKERT